MSIVRKWAGLAMAVALLFAASAYAQGVPGGGGPGGSGGVGGHGGSDNGGAPVGGMPAPSMAPPRAPRIGSSRAPTEFTGGSFSCLQYVNGLGDSSMGRMQTDIAHIWVLGYLAGYYKGQGKLEFSDDPADAQAIDTQLVQHCKEIPQAPILGIVLQDIASQPHKLPKAVMGELSPPTYTCGQHLAARAGASVGAATADLAEMWAFAFIQGFKNVSVPELEIDVSSKPQLIAVLNKACGNAKDKLFLDYAAMVAEKVKMGG